MSGASGRDGVGIESAGGGGDGGRIVGRSSVDGFAIGFVIGRAMAFVGGVAGTETLRIFAD